MNIIRQILEILNSQNLSSKCTCTTPEANDMLRRMCVKDNEKVEQFAIQLDNKEMLHYGIGYIIYNESLDVFEYKITSVDRYTAGVADFQQKTRTYATWNRTINNEFSLVYGNPPNIQEQEFIKTLPSFYYNP